MAIKNGTVPVGDSEADYISFGKGEETLVMIPGLGDGLVTVRGKALLGAIAFRKYAARYRVVIISRKNRLEEDATIETMARDQAQAMRALGIDRAHILGISQGGMIAQHLAVRDPELVDRLVLTVTAPRANPLLVNNCCRWIGMARRGDYQRLMADIIARAHPEPYRKHYLKLTPFMKLVGKPRYPDRFFAQAEACIRHNATKILGQISQPTLVIGGQLDDTLGPDASLALAAAIPHCVLWMYPEHGHALYEDAKDFHTRVLSFLSKESPV